VITANELSDVLITVTRYFGGVLLGAGGLTRAYSTAASIAVKGCQIQTFMPCIPITITLSYTLFGKFQAFCSMLSYIKMTEPVFTDEVSVDIKIPTEMKDEFLFEITDILNANFKFVEYDEIYGDFS
jgi:putative IMPACT (imprinted ancient) family translation regulator